MISLVVTGKMSINTKHLQVVANTFCNYNMSKNNINMILTIFGELKPKIELIDLTTVRCDNVSIWCVRPFPNTFLL